MTPDQTLTVPQRLAAVVIVIALIAAAVAGSWFGRQPPPRPAVFSAATTRGDPQRCAECHAEITDQFSLAPHSRTLHPGTSAEAIERFAGRSFQRADSGVSFQYHQHDGEVRLATAAYPRELPLTWLFGSGTHAQTPLITWTDDDGRTAAIEHAVSWYPPGDLGVTLGADTLTDTTGVNALGRHWRAAETANCFGCHSTYVPVESGRIDFHRLIPNISCARCHVDTQRHLDEVDRDRPVSIERLSSLSPMEAVDRCGECHRRASEMGGEIEPDNPTIVRFAPVGLVQSPCFQKQADVKLDNGEPARLDCATCHDPHRPAIHDWQHHAAVCRTCHANTPGHAPECSSATLTGNCLPCHMPQVPSNPHLKFTDHWIRIRGDR